MGSTPKRGPGQPKKEPTVIGYIRLSQKEEDRVSKEVMKTGKSKAAIIRNAVQRYFKLPEA